MKTKILSLSAVALVGTVLAPKASAVIITGGVTGGSSLTAGGTFVKLSPGFTASDPDNTVGDNTFDTPNLYGFDEDQNVQVVGSPLSVDLLAGTGLPGTLAIGTVVASHYVFFDPRATTGQLGFVDFDADILAVISSTNNLSASDYLANTGVIYLNPTLRGLEQGDSATIDGTLPNRLLVDWDASSPGDYVRVLTEFSPGGSVPEGGASWLLLALSGSVLLGAKRLLLTA